MGKFPEVGRLGHVRQPAEQQAEAAHILARVIILALFAESGNLRNPLRPDQDVRGSEPPMDPSTLMGITDRPGNPLQNPHPFHHGHTAVGQQKGKRDPVDPFRHFLVVPVGSGGTDHLENEGMFQPLGAGRIVDTDGHILSGCPLPGPEDPAAGRFDFRPQQFDVTQMIRRILFLFHHDRGIIKRSAREIKAGKGPSLTGFPGKVYHGLWGNEPLSAFLQPPSPPLYSLPIAYGL